MIYLVMHSTDVLLAFSTKEKAQAYVDAWGDPDVFVEAVEVDTDAIHWPKRNLED